MEEATDTNLPEAVHDYRRAATGPLFLQYITTMLGFLSARHLTYEKIPETLSERLSSLFGVIHLVVFPAFGTGGEPSELLGLALQHSVRFRRRQELSEIVKEIFGSRPVVEVPINLSSLDELKLTDANFTVITLAEDNSGAPRDTMLVSALGYEFVLRCIQRFRTLVRRDIVRIRVTTTDMGSFSHKIISQLLPRWLRVQGASIFVIDKLTGELQLRGTTGIVGGPRMRDVSIDSDGQSWVSRTFNDRQYRFEYDEGGGLRRGATVESVGPVYSRAYWPLQLQFHAESGISGALRNGCIGVFRGVNRVDAAGRYIPFSIFDSIFIEFLSELIYVVGEPFVDRSVDGFDRDQAFHAAASSVNGALKNIALAQAILFGADVQPFPLDPAIRFAEGIDQGVIEKARVALKNAHALAQNILSQVERANIRATAEKRDKNVPVTDKLLSDVILKSVNLIPSHLTVHSARVSYNINRIFDLDLPPPVYGATGDLVSVFNNIFENCVKYRKRNEYPYITVGIKICKSEVIVSVADRGIGVEQEDIERIFTRGYRTPAAKKHHMQGGGLGLAYCRELLTDCGGRIWAENRDGGLTIYVALKRPFVASNRQGV
jgi:signal transduction histidine kinase